MRAMTHADHDETEWLNGAGEYLFPLPVTLRPVVETEAQPVTVDCMNMNPPTVDGCNTKGETINNAEPQYALPSAERPEERAADDAIPQTRDSSFQTVEKPSGALSAADPGRLATLASLLDDPGFAESDHPVNETEQVGPAAGTAASIAFSSLLELSQQVLPKDHPTCCDNRSNGAEEKSQTNAFDRFPAEPSPITHNNTARKSKCTYIVGFSDPMSACLFRQALVAYLAQNTAGRPFLSETPFPSGKTNRKVVYLSALSCPPPSAHGGSIDLSAWAIGSLGRLGHPSRNKADYGTKEYFDKANDTVAEKSPKTNSKAATLPIDEAICDPLCVDDCANAVFILDATSCSSTLASDLEIALKDLLFGTSDLCTGDEPLVVLTDAQVITSASNQASVDEWSDRIANLWSSFSHVDGATLQCNTCLVNPPSTAKQFEAFLQQWWLWFGYDPTADISWLSKAVETALPKLGFDFYPEDCLDTPDVLYLFTGIKTSDRRNESIEKPRLQGGSKTFKRHYPDLGLLCSLLTLLRDGFRIESTDEFLHSISYQRQASESNLLGDIVDSILDCLIGTQSTVSKRTRYSTVSLDFDSFLSTLASRRGYSGRRLRRLILDYPLTASLFSCQKSSDGTELMQLRLSGLLSCLISKDLLDRGGKAVDPVRSIIEALFELSRKLSRDDWLLLFHETITSSNTRTGSPLLAQSLIEESYAMLHADPLENGGREPFCGRALNQARIVIIQISLGLQLSLMGNALKAWEDFFFSKASTDQIEAIEGARARGRLNPDSIFVLRNSARRTALEAHRKAEAGEQSRSSAAGETMVAAWIGLITLDPHVAGAKEVLDSISKDLASKEQIDCLYAIALFECLSWTYDMKIPLPFEITARDILESDTAKAVAAFIMQKLSSTDYTYASCTRLFWFYALSHECLIGRRAFEQIAREATDNLARPNADSSSKVCALEVLAFCAVSKNRSIVQISFDAWQACLLDALLPDHNEELLLCLIVGWGSEIAPSYFLDTLFEKIDPSDFGSPTEKLMVLFSACVNLQAEYDEDVLLFVKANEQAAKRPTDRLVDQAAGREAEKECDQADTLIVRNNIAYLVDHGYGDAESRRALDVEELLLPVVSSDSDAPWSSVEQIDIFPFINLVLHYAIVDNNWDQARRVFRCLKGKVDGSSVEAAVEFWGQLANRNICEGLLVKLLLHNLGIPCFTTLPLDETARLLWAETIEVLGGFEQKPSSSDSVSLERTVEIVATYYDIPLSINDRDELLFAGEAW